MIVHSAVVMALAHIIRDYAAAGHTDRLIKSIDTLALSSSTHTTHTFFFVFFYPPADG